MPSMLTERVPCQVSGGAACGEGGLTNCAGGNSDPVMYGFAGRSFNFLGAPGKIYNIISTQNMQVSLGIHCSAILIMVYTRTCEADHASHCFMPTIYK